MIKIGISNRTRYWQQYVFSNPPEGFCYKRALDIPFHLLKTNNQFLLNTKWFFPFQGIDLYHTYNSIVPGARPWVVEVESFIPRYGQMKESSMFYRWGVSRLQSKWCKGIIFTSEYTKKMNAHNLKMWRISEEKQHVIYRAVEPYSNLLDGSESTFNILFAGNAFYRKGGVELLKALELISNKDIRVTIISNFEVDWEIFPDTNEKDYVRKRLLEDKRITCLTNLPHNQVVEKMRSSHVFIATTFADPFNNTILEAMACGVPIIATDIRSIPEVVQANLNGFTITPNKNNRNQIVDFIKEKLEFLLNNEKERKGMAAASSTIVMEKFSLAARNAKLTALYQTI